MKFDPESIYKLLPAVYRLRDHDLVSGDETPPLKALLTILAEEVEILEESIDQLYDDQFIETCDEWVIPYIGELIGSKPLSRIPTDQFSQRTEVANTIGYRRRKGTLSIIEQLARDITNWDASVVEYFQLLVTTQYLNHLRLEKQTVPHLKDWQRLEYVNTPFDSIPRTADVRNIRSKRGKYNILNIGIFLWRIQTFPRAMAHANSFDVFRYSFHPLGVNTALYNFPTAERELTNLATPENMPMRLNRTILSQQLTDYYGSGKDLLVSIGENAITASEICIGDLSDWDNPSVSPPADILVVDPRLGRMMFGADFETELTENSVIVNYSYGVLYTTGGGPYNREKSFSDTEETITVSQIPGNGDFTTIQEALNEAQSDSASVVIEIIDNFTYEESLSVSLAQGQKIELRAENEKHSALQLTENFTIEGNSLSEFQLNGLLLSGAHIEVLPDTDLHQLTISHCTIQPNETEHKLLLNSSTEVYVNHSIMAGIQCNSESDIRIENSIIDVMNPEAKAITGLENQLPVLTIKNTTIRGEVDAKMIRLAENSIFISLLHTEFLQKGCVRYSYILPESVTPRTFHCYPAAGEDEATIQPFFNTTEFGKPEYFQLNQLSHHVFLTGADDGAEIGVYHNLYQPQKEKNLRTRLNEYMRFGMEAGIFYAS